MLMRACTCPGFTPFLDFNGGCDVYHATLNAALLDSPEVFLGLRVAAHWLQCPVSQLQELLPSEVQLRFRLEAVTPAIAQLQRTSAAGAGSRAPLLMVLGLDDYQLLAQTAPQGFAEACCTALGRWMTSGQQVTICKCLEIHTCAGAAEQDQFCVEHR